MTTSIDPAIGSVSDPNYIAGDEFQTELISQLANEIYAEDHRGARAPAEPAPAADFAWLERLVPEHLPVPGALPNPSTLDAAAVVLRAATAADTPRVAVPNPADAALVTPSTGPAGAQTVYQPAAAGGYAPAGVPSAGWPDLSGGEAFAFGEPRFSPGAGNGRTLKETPVLPASAAEGQGFYFLPRSTPTTVPATAAGPDPVPNPVHEREVNSLAGRAAGASLSAFDAQAIRRDFPALHQSVNGRPLIWLDNAATTHKPQSVIDITSEYYSKHNSNIHRAAHTLAERSTDLFEGARDKLRDFIGAGSSKEIVFLRGTTEAINLVAQSFGRKNIGAGDEILITHIEHHANIVPWQLLAQQTGAVLRVAPVNERGELILEKFAALLSPRTKIVSVAHVANSLGTINPIEQIIPLAHALGIPVLVDAAQSSPHIPLNVRALDADFLVLSGHKIFGPTGIGILYGKAELLESLPPWQGGGHMIRDVTFEKTTFNHIPEKFEAGTPDIAGAIGLGAAADYLLKIGLPAIAAYEHELLVYATEALSQVRGIRLIGTARNKASVLSFVIAGTDPDDVARHLDRQGIATRSGHHCAQPALRHFGVEKTVRASLALYNTRSDVDALVDALNRLPHR